MGMAPTLNRINCTQAAGIVGRYAVAACRTCCEEDGDILIVFDPGPRPRTGLIAFQHRRLIRAETRAVECKSPATPVPGALAWRARIREQLAAYFKFNRVSDAR
jgi:hypothetical protein